MKLLSPSHVCSQLFIRSGSRHVLDSDYPRGAAPALEGVIGLDVHGKGTGCSVTMG